MNGKRQAMAITTLVLLALLSGIAAGCGSESPERIATSTAKAQEKQMVEALSRVCEGSAVPEAAAYRQTSGIHSLVVLRGQPGVSWRVDDSYARAEWQPQAVQSAELVACLKIDAALLETCPYKLENNQSASLERYQYVTYVGLYQAATGALVAENSWKGSEPAKCSAETSFKSGETVKKVYGVAVGGAEIQSWLEPYVNLP